MAKTRMTPVLALVASLFAGPLAAHEVWIDAQEWQVAPSDIFKANLRNGELFEGIPLGWFPPRIKRAMVMSRGQVIDLQGRAGDMPAFNIKVAEPGLNVVGYESTPSALTYDNYEKFESFAVEKGHAALIADAPRVAAPHEVYSRHAKALFAVGAGAGADAALGFEIELVAETNPYTQPQEPMRVRAIYQDAPLAEARVTVFEKRVDGTVDVTELTTDAEGRAAFATTPGSTYLVDTVMLRKASGATVAKEQAMWESLWASLTFGAPEAQ